MAVNKRKVLDAARKYAQKGAKEKALKEYNTLLKLDPRDAKLHLEIGDCYRRWGQISEAVTQYSRVAEQYKGDGFDARAVAVFKQILNLDQKLYSASVSLSELYQRMGLDSEALAALQSAADGYHRDGQKQEALELLRRMATIDPTNTTSRLKVAELLRQEGLEDEAVAEYEAVAAEFTRQGATESFLTAQERILDLRPDRADILTSIACGLIELKKPERAEPFAKRALDLDPKNIDVHEILCDIYKVLGNAAELAATTRKLAQVYRDGGDEERARELVQRLPITLDGNPEGKATGSSESALLSEGELLPDDAPALPGSGAKDGLDLGADEELELEFDDEPGDGDEDDFLLDDDLGGEFDDDGESASSEPPPPEGDPEQLFAEASVYLRYGKRAQAITSLEAVLRQEADHRGALEKLGEAYVESERNAEAVEVWCRAAVLARNDGDDSGFDVLRDRIGAIDARAAKQLGDAEATRETEVLAMGDEPDAADEQSEEIGFEPETELDPDDDVELELDVTVADDAFEIEDDESPESEIELDADVDEVDVDVDAGGIEIDLDDTEADEEVEIDLDDAEADEEGIEIDLDDAEADEEGIEIDFDDAEAGEDEDEEEIDIDLSAAEDDAEPDADGPLPERISEELEEAEFYYQQELFDEAEAVYRRILKIAPDHPDVLARLAELAEARGEDPAEAVRAPEPKQASKPKAKKAKKQDEPKSADEADAEAEDSAIDTEMVAPEEDRGDDRTEVAEVSIDFAADEAALQLDAPPAPQPDEVAAARARSRPSESSTQQLEAPAADADEGHFDLAAELRDVLEEDDAEDARQAASAVRSTVEEGFESVFADFKQGVSAALSEDDYETRYDLGIAYREMELYEDAIGEFRLCLESENRKVSSLHMMGLCALDLGRTEDAANHLDQALATNGLPEGQQAGIRFDLGRAYEAVGDLDRARSSYQAVIDHDPDFPGVQERLAALDSGGAGAGAASQASPEDSGFESFDDLLADANTDAAVVEPESFESFDDLITAAEVEADSEEDSGPGKRRKKKISFV